MIARVLRVAAQGVRARIGRSLLTAASLFIGVFAIVVIQAGAGAARDAIVADSVLENGKTATFVVSIVDGRQAIARSESLYGTLQKEIDWIHGACALMATANGTVGDAWATEIRLVRGPLRDIKPYPIVSGRWAADQSQVGEVVANQAAASHGLAVGQRIRLSVAGRANTVGVTVVGIAKDTAPDPRLYSPLPADGRLAPSSVKSIELFVHAPLKNPGPLAALIANEYARYFDTGPKLTMQRADKVDEFADQLRTIALIFSVVAGLSLIVGSLGILNIGLATIKERSDELSLRRSFGATKVEVIAMIVAEGQIVALGAAVPAVAIGLAAFPFVVAQLSKGVPVSAPALPVMPALFGVFTCCTAAFIGSLAPALRAASVPIASIMRN